MLKGFRDFVLRGNVIDLAVGVIIGAAFKGIVDKLVEGVFNPALGAVVGQPNFDNIVLGPVKVGVVLTATVNFLLTAGVIYFFLVLPMNRLLARMKRNAPPEEPPPDVKLLGEIRDLLAKRSAQP